MSAGDGAEAKKEASVVNGLYIFDIEMRDGKRGQARGVVVLCDGRIMGGDSYFYYTGSYTFRNGKWRGDMIVNQHTEAVGRTLAFGGREVTCGFSGDYSVQRRRGRRHGPGRQDHRDVYGETDAKGCNVSGALWPLPRNDNAPPGCPNRTARCCVQS
ncbi:hypothetical protein ACVOMS_06510 [Bradyrhizobium guangxiense]